uniref:Heparanase-like n=1 Tax=Diabrotica virgifera virgifera TaxID=50390 RepID=A0A6P7GLM7_DIAVI
MLLQKDRLDESFNSFIEENKRYRLLLMMTSMLLTIMVVLVYCFDVVLPITTEDPIQMLYIENDKPSTFKTSPYFLSVALDDVVIADGFKDFDMNNEKLTAMIRYLSPGYFRIGGNLADRLIFSLKNKTDIDIENVDQLYDSSNFGNIDINYAALPNITLFASDWLKLNNLSSNTNMSIFFGLNALLRFKNGSWDYRNAEEMIKFSDENGLRVNWELGNEPNSFKHKFNEEVNATQMAKDFKQLRSILNKYNNFKKSLLVGPDVTRPEEEHKESQIFLKEFVASAKDVVDKVTWHQYYLNGRTAEPKDFVDPTVLDLLKYQITRVKELTNLSGRSIWLGETSSAYGGGAPNMSDRFISSFMWLDKLGLAAKMGVEVVMRQSIFHGNYSLLDENYDPNPDWWISFMYKNLVGRNVVPYQSKTNKLVRLYVHCLQDAILPSVVIFGVNLGSKTAKIGIEGLDPDNMPLILMGFEFQSKDWFTKDIYLNGVLMKLMPGNKIPDILPRRKFLKPYVEMPPYSLVFWVTTRVKMEACL